MPYTIEKDDFVWSIGQVSWDSYKSPFADATKSLVEQKIQFILDQGRLPDDWIAKCQE